MFYGHTFIEARCVGMAPSATRYYRKGHFCDRFFAKFNDTESVYDREPERSRVNTPTALQLALEILMLAICMCIYAPYAPIVNDLGFNGCNPDINREQGRSMAPKTRVYLHYTHC